MLSIRCGEYNFNEDTKMKKLLSGLCTAALALSLTATSLLPVNAAPVMAPRTTSATTDVWDIQYRRYPRRGEFRPAYRGEFRRPAYRGNCYGCFNRRGNIYYYNGYRGYRDYRPGYRVYNGWWFPAGAFVAGAIIGGALAAPPAVSSGNAHVRWCYDRYRSYRASDNTYQPYNGPRQQCISPY
ncbi:BA14K-like protein [Mesorhizobium albiziae]|uniref:Lectin-like protein BA14k n=2 Tax=Neomesorhizobium albiziae TaxID=335020 RepID=A0A1I4BVW8_9HYPH|nr:hypothetical protein GCM10007937_13580 [Mesorhizobium albiziae]SFK72209.1 BA14K-like protein [Mesorhizobium albiziae]